DAQRDKRGACGGLRRVVPEMSSGAPVGQGLLMSPSRRWLRCPSSLSLCPYRCGTGFRGCRAPGAGGGVRFTLACVIAVAIAARLAGCDSFTAIGEWAASRPQRVLKALGCPLGKRAGVYIAPSEKTVRRGGGPAGLDHDPAGDLLCGWTAELAAACEIFSPAQLQQQRRDAARTAKAQARKAREKAREAEKKARKAARRDQAARVRAEEKARKAGRQARRAAAAAAAASAQAVAGGRAKLPAGSAFGRIPVP